jgi:hypothetical protein
VAGMTGASTAVALSVLSLVGVWLVLTSITFLSRKNNSIMVGVR